jgi:hypothetical protein
MVDSGDHTFQRFTCGLSGSPALTDRSQRLRRVPIDRQHPRRRRLLAHPHGATGRAIISRRHAPVTSRAKRDDGLRFLCLVVYWLEPDDLQYRRFCLRQFLGEFRIVLRHVVCVVSLLKLELDALGCV